MVLCSIGLVSGLSYYELSKTTQENSTIRIDRAARAAVAILCYGTNSVFHPEFDEAGNPLSLHVAEAAGTSALAPSETLDKLMAAIGKTNQGAANLFAWNGSAQSFDRFATTFRSPDGGPPPAFSIRHGHPAFASLAKGHPFVGNVPVQGRLRLAYLTPILAPGGGVAGAIAVDVGWVDDLTLAENRLKTRITTAAIIILTAVILIGGLLLRLELRPLRQLARTADELAGGDQPTSIPFTERKDEIGDLAHGLEKVNDLQDKLRKLAYTDPVTTAGNRTRYFSDLSKALKRARQENYSASLIHLDFNGFAKVNDIFGQQVGNRVLLQAYARLASIFGPSAKIARISADDFCIILPFDNKGAIAEDYAVQALDLLSSPFHLEEGEIRVEPSIGIALLPQDAEDAETAHRVAGLALRAAKDKEGTRYVFFSPPLNERIQKEMLTETLLRAALKTRQLELHYQPQVSPADGHLLGLEALIRWPSEKRGFIPPGEFIPVAEKTGLVIELGQYVLEAACAQAAKWRLSEFDFGHISINVSPLQFRQPSFAATVRRALEDYDLPANKLCLEVTENVFVDTSEQTVLDILSELQEIGVQLSLDDFGSGYSSLIYLHRLPFQELKIDRAFIAEADLTPQREHLFQGIVGLARSLGLRVIAEGAETEGEFTLAIRHGCDALQGYFCAPAVPADEVQIRLKAFQGELSARLGSPAGHSVKKRA
ncbi:bifunctional diguanylate cyclase/phosphodiesterase [Roseibium sediminicola]|uniref:EAL domain-containing protein n=1 Tax=Roseibium sediminicola TaxID=2933272 RepID=A0ABT0GZ16_9HYPH|nr:EAL domain-containing protein [Roseibium sp. CAU 1639]MCK7614576.1 EAL domain-containing protein [Roseibium sp. CAU 1639]